MTLKENLDKFFKENKIFNSSVYNPPKEFFQIQACSKSLFKIIPDYKEDSSSYRISNILSDMFCNSFDQKNGYFSEHFNLIFQIPIYHFGEFFKSIYDLNFASALSHFILWPVLSIFLSVGLLTRSVATLAESIIPTHNNNIV